MTTPGAETDVPTQDGEQPVVEQRLHPVTPLRRAWAPVAVLIGWAVHDPDQAQRQLTRLTTTDACCSASPRPRPAAPCTAF